MQVTFYILDGTVCFGVSDKEWYIKLHQWPVILDSKYIFFLVSIRLLHILTLSFISDPHFSSSSRLFYLWFIIYTIPTPAAYLPPLLENSLELPNEIAPAGCLHSFWVHLIKRVITAHWNVTAGLSAPLKADNLSGSFWSPQHRRWSLDSRYSIRICWMVDLHFALNVCILGMLCTYHWLLHVIWYC